MRHSPRSVMLFAAGFGTRMGALTQSRPKPLIEVAGHALLDHALSLAQAITPTRVVVNTHYLSAQIHSHLTGQDVLISEETPDILETGGGLRQALPLLGPDPVFTLNTDYVWSGPNPLACLSAAWDPDKMDALLLCLPKSRALGHSGAGDFLLDGAGHDGAGQATRGPGLIYAGAQIIRTDGLAAIPEAAFSLNRLWDDMLQKGRLYGLEYPGQWCDVGRPEGIALAETMLASANV